jgi:hypothetical protein
MRVGKRAAAMLGMLEKEAKSARSLAATSRVALAVTARVCGNGDVREITYMHTHSHTCAHNAYIYT